MGFGTSKIKLSALNLYQKEIESSKNLYNKYLENKTFNSSNFQIDLFKKVLPVKIFPWLNSIFVNIKENAELTNFDNVNYFTYFTYLLTNYHTNDNEEFYMYYRRNIFIILYDLCSGNIGEFDKNKKLDINIFNSIMKFALNIFYGQHYSKSIIIDEEYLKEYLKTSLEHYYDKNINEIKSLELEKILKEKFYNFDSYLRLYFKSFLLNENTSNFNSALPKLEEKLSSFPFELYFIYSLSNPLVFGSKKAFKIFDCEKNGYNLSNLMRSFIGFTGKILLLITHKDKTDDGKLQYLGMFLNSNIKECFEEPCGDDSCSFFTLLPKLINYKTKTNKVCEKPTYVYLSSKNLSYTKKTPGIGMGANLFDDYRFWLDNNDLFQKSYFKSEDENFENGSPFNEEKKMLNILNVEVLGIGSDDDKKNLEKKIEKDYSNAQEKKQTESTQIVTNEFNKEMFFENTFKHEKQTDQAKK